MFSILKYYLFSQINCRKLTVNLGLILWTLNEYVPCKKSHWKDHKRVTIRVPPFTLTFLSLTGPYMLFKILSLFIKNNNNVWNLCDEIS